MSAVQSISSKVISRSVGAHRQRGEEFFVCLVCLPIGLSTGGNSTVWIPFLPWALLFSRALAFFGCTLVSSSSIASARHSSLQENRVVARRRTWLCLARDEPLRPPRHQLHSSTYSQDKQSLSDALATVTAAGEESRYQVATRSRLRARPTGHPIRGTPCATLLSLSSTLTHSLGSLGLQSVASEERPTAQTHRQIHFTRLSASQ